jgi:hypothetical protein
VQPRGHVSKARAVLENGEGAALDVEEHADHVALAVKTRSSD